jgi:hypothetical protein
VLKVVLVTCQTRFRGSLSLVFREIRTKGGLTPRIQIRLNRLELFVDQVKPRLAEHQSRMLPGVQRIRIVAAQARQGECFAALP